MQLRFRVIEVLFGLLYAYIAAIAFILVYKGFDLADILKATFIIFLAFFMPFIAISKNVWFLVGTLIFSLLVFLQYKFFSTIKLRYFVFVDLVLWEIYGIRSLIAVTGGA